MAGSFEKLSSVNCLAETRSLGGARVLCSERAGLVVGSFVQIKGRRYFGELIVARIPREEAILRSLAGRSTWVAGLASESRSYQEAEAGIVNPRNILNSDLNPLLSKEDNGNTGNSEIEDDSGEEDGAPTASPAPWMSEEEAKTVVSEVILNEDDLTVIEYPANEEAQPDSNPLNAMADSLLNKVNGDGRGFSLTEVGGFLKIGEDAGELEVPDISASGFDVKEGVSPLAQWTSTELTMQHSQLARIVTDVFYMQIAFAFFGGVRIAEALLNVYSTSPPDFGRSKELVNAFDPLTISWLANNVREPLEGLMTADPLDLEKVVTLKSDIWKALHAFYERQWKVMATLAMARSLSLVASHVPTAEVLTERAQWLWNAFMALPVF